MTEEQVKSFEANIMGAIAKLSERMDNMQIAINGLVGIITRIDFRLDENTKQTQANTEKIAELSKQTQANTEKIAELSKQTQTNTEKIVALTEQVTENTKNTKMNTEQLVYLTEQMTAIKLEQKNLAS